MYYVAKQQKLMKYIMRDLIVISNDDGAEK
jgi:hypothetical protein